MDSLRTGASQIIKNQEIYEKWISLDIKSKIEDISTYVLTTLRISNCPLKLKNDLRSKIKFFDANLQRRWKQCSRNHALFKKRHEAWLQNNFTLPKSILDYMHSESTINRPQTSRGRPQIPFLDASTKTKKRRVANLLTSNSTEELRFAAEMSERSSGVGGGVESCEKQKTLTVKEALALYLDLDLSEKKYNILRSVVNEFHKDLFPSLYKLRNYKKQMLPTKREFSETTASVDLQELLHKTVESIADISAIKGDTNAILTCKWGFDGSSGHSQYKQVFSDSNNTDEYLFLIALSPLKMVEEGTGVEIWKNPRCSSTMFCRPIKFMFAKECPELIRNEETKMKSQIEQLTPTTINKNGFKLSISYKLIFTMVDGSICNILSNTNSASKCFLCGATPKEMNSVQVHEKPVIGENFRFGLSTLHSWIKCFECLLHISYRLPFRSWRVAKDSENKKVFDERKKQIQTMFKTQLGLNIDKPKPGFGSTNDGNTARRFFKNAKLTAEITGLDEQLVYKFSIILRVLASGLNIDINQFSTLLAEVRELYLELYSWYYMPISVHKLLIHGPDIISSFEIPIGLLSEEALEASHKEFRKHRLGHARKSSRVNTNQDILTALLLRSDPLISSIRKKELRLSKEDQEEIGQYIQTTESMDTSSVSFTSSNFEDIENSDSDS